MQYEGPSVVPLQTSRSIEEAYPTVSSESVTSRIDDREGEPTKKSKSHKSHKHHHHRHGNPEQVSSSTYSAPGVDSAYSGDGVTADTTAHDVEESPTVCLTL